MINYITKIKWWLQDLKRLPKATYLCYKYPFLRFRTHHLLYTRCWYYCIPEGWRKAFGMQIIKEISDSLYRAGGRKLVKEYTISDIKEKFGALRWYDFGAPTEVHKIINKYEIISKYTCIECGKPATVQSIGWICPYCNDCVGDRNYIHFGHEHGPSWYGWIGNIDCIPKEEWDAEEEKLNKLYEQCH